MARQRPGNTLRVVALALAAWLTPSCLFCGGQTGECGSSDEASGSVTGGAPVCGPPRAIWVESVSKWGFSGRQLLDIAEGTYVGTLLPCAPTGAPDATSTEEELPVTFTLTYHDAPVLAVDCEPTLSTDVSVVLDVGDGWLVRDGTARLSGQPQALNLVTSLAPTGDGSETVATLEVHFDAENQATGRIVSGAWCGTYSVAKTE